MNYIGSKKSLLEFIEKSIKKIVTEKNYKFSDLFAGTGIVGRYFKDKGHEVLSNDMQYYSYALIRNYIGNNSPLLFSGLTSILPNLKDANHAQKQAIVIEYLNNLPGLQGFIFKNYAPTGSKGQEHIRMYFSDENALKCDAIRTQLQEWKDSDKINEDEFYFLLCSLLEAIDKVANTASVYGAYLKKLKKSAQKTMKLEPAKFSYSDYENIAYNMDVSKLVKTTTHDVVYLDPPYNQRQYAANYHLLETIAKYDNPTLSGKTGMRNYDEQKSNYCRKSQVKDSFTELVDNLEAKYIFLSYNCEGLLSLADIKEVMSRRGEYGVFTKKYKRFKADKTESRIHKQDSVTEYLHYVKIVK